jgi:hypothetical protein
LPKAAARGGPKRTRKLNRNEKGAHGRWWLAGARDKEERLKSICKKLSYRRIKKFEMEK